MQRFPLEPYDEVLPSTRQVNRDLRLLVGFAGLLDGDSLGLDDRVRHLSGRRLFNCYRDSMRRSIVRQVQQRSRTLRDPQTIPHVALRPSRVCSGAYV